MLDVVPSSSGDRRVVAVTAYSKAAVLQDCTPDPSTPLEFNGLTLLQIASKLCEPFGLSPKLAQTIPPIQEGTKFPKVAIKATEKILGFLADLAAQRGLILGTDEEGEPVFRTSVSGVGIPVALLKDTEQPLTKISATFTPQNYYSGITCLGTTKHGRKGAKTTELNPYLPDVVRPFCIELDDTDQGDMGLATKARIGRMFGNVASWEVELATWFTPTGDLWAPDMRVLVEAPGAMIYKTTELLVRAVDLKKNEDGTTTTKLGLMLPGAFSGESPSSLPWVD